MALRVERRDGTLERHVLIGMIVSRRVLASIAERWKHGLFASKWADLVAGWCVEHFRKYNHAPGPSIEYYFRDWAESGTRERDTIEAIESLLVSLSDEAVRLKNRISPDQLIDIAGEQFERVQLRAMAEQVQAHLERGEIAKAREVVVASRKLEIGVGSGIDALTDVSALEIAFERVTESVIELPGSYGLFFGNALSRGSFVSFLAKEKGYKSFYLQDLTYRAVLQGRNVAYFELGDHTQDDVLIRFACRACDLPYEAGKTTKRIPRPVELISNADSPPEIKREFVTEPVVTIARAREVFDELARGVGGARLKLSCHPAGSLSVSGAEQILDRWAQDDWHPDVIVFDYADLAAPQDRRHDKLEQINDTWMSLRGLSQKSHSLVLTATQCTREGFDAPLLTREHVGGYHMKLAYVTLMAGINQRPKEKDEEIIRLNIPAGRTTEFGERRVLWCAACLSTANPVVLSSF